MAKGAKSQGMKAGTRKTLGALREFYRSDMRLSYYVAIGLVLLGIAVNLIFPHGWAVWPFLFVAGLMSFIHEAAERNGQGVPPLYAYAFLVGVIVLWVAVTLLFSMVNPFVLFLGLVALGYQCARGYLQEHERNKLIESRRAQGRCIHCGELIEEKTAVCLNCGQEPDPTGQRMRRVASIVGGRKNAAHARSAIRYDSMSTSASKREQALLAKPRCTKRAAAQAIERVMKFPRPDRGRNRLKCQGRPRELGLDDPLSGCDEADGSIPCRLRWAGKGITRSSRWSFWRG